MMGLKIFTTDTLQIIKNAIVQNNMTIIKEVMNNDNVDYRYSFGVDNYTPLLHAVEQDKPEIVKFLILLGANINAKITRGNKGVLSLVNEYNLEMLELLLIEKICRMAKNLDYAGLDNEVVQVLGSHPSLKTAINKPSIVSKKTALVHAIESSEGNGVNLQKSLNMVNFLLENGADVNNPNNIISYSIALMNKRWDIMHSLFDTDNNYLHDNRANSNYSEKLAMYAQAIATKNSTLVSYFWKIVESNKDGKIKLGSQRLLLLKELLAHAYDVQYNNPLTFQWKMNIIQKKHSNNDFSLSEPIDIILVFTKETITGDKLTYKITYNNTRKSFILSQSSVDENDIDLLDYYYKKTIHINTDELFYIVGEIQKHNNVASPVDTIYSILSSTEIAELPSLQLRKVWLEHNIQYYTLLGRTEFTPSEKVDLKLSQRVLRIEEDINSIKSNYTLLLEKFRELKSNYEQFELLVESAIVGIVERLNYIDESLSPYDQSVNSGNNQLSILNENKRLVEEQRIILREYQELHRGLSDNLQKLENYPNDRAVLLEKINTLSTEVRRTTENNNIKIEDIIYKLAQLQPFIAHTIEFSQIISKQSHDNEYQLQLDRLEPIQREFYINFVRKLNSIYLASAAVQADILSSQKTGFNIDIGSIIGNIGSNLPLIGPAASMFGSIISQLDRSYQEKRIRLLYKMVNNAFEMNDLAEKIALNIAVDIGRWNTLNQEKFHQSSIRERLVNIFKEPIEKMDSITPEQNEEDNSSSSVEHSERNEGKKYANIITSMLVEKIYNGEAKEALEGDITFKAEILKKIILKKYGIQEATVPYLTDAFKLAEDIAARIVEEGHSRLDNSKSKHPKRENEFIGKLAEILHEKCIEIISNPFLRQSFIANLVEEFIRLEIFYISRTFITGTHFNINKEFKIAQDKFITNINLAISKISDNLQNDISIVGFVVGVTYNNPLLNKQELLQNALHKGGAKAINLLIELGQDKDIAEQILLAIDDIGVERVLEIFFSPVKSTELQTIQQTHYDTTLETLAKIESTLGKEALNEINGWFKYASAALSNNPLSASATKVIHIIGNLVDNLEECLDFGIAYESIDVETQVTIILSQLEHWFDFVASGTTFVGLPPRYPGFDPDDEPNGGSGNGGQGLIYRGSADIHQNEEDITLFIGQNITALLES